MYQVLAKLLIAEISKIIAKKLFGTVLIGGVKKFLVDKIAGLIIGKIFKPAYNAIEDFIKTIVDKIEVKKAVKELEKAKTKDEIKKTFDNLP